MIVALIKRFKSYIKNRNCIHDKYYETKACDAICINCGNNLGFIEVSRKKFPKGEEWRNQPHVLRR